MKTEKVKLSQIKVNGANPRLIKDEKFAKLVNSILVFPKMLEIRPIVVDNTFVSLGGNMRYRGLSFIASLSIGEIKERLSGLREFEKKTTAEQNALFDYWEKWLDSPTACIIKASELSDEEQKAFIIKDNVGYGEWDHDLLANEWDAEDLDDWGLDVWQDNNEDDLWDNSDSKNGSLADRFVIPPFSILDTRKDRWRVRKKIWRKLIGDMGESRESLLFKSPEMKYPGLYHKTKEHRKSLGLGFREYLDKYVSDEVKEKEVEKVLSKGVSLFDPVLSEIMCKWFTPEKGAKIFDCFAGDTQKGFVFGHCGYNFTGIELRQEQVDINNKVIKERGLDIKYICDDGQNVANHFEPKSQDLLFSCPPYYNLEVYSDMEKDASNQDTYDDFLVILKNGFKNALACLKDDRFAVIVVGDIRNKKTGFYYNFVDDVKQIFKENGVPLYNEIILIESAGSSALRASRYMDNRKVVKMHQNILIFYNGNPKNISKTFPKIEFSQEDQKIFDEVANAEDKEE